MGANPIASDLFLFRGKRSDRVQAAAVQARSRARLDSASARDRANVVTDTPISWGPWETSALSGGTSRATARSLNSLLYRATVVPQCPQGYRGIEATTTVTQGGRRQERTVPLLAKFKTWLANAVHSVLPKDSLGEAVHSALKNCTAVTKFTAAAHLDASNNHALSRRD